MKEAGTMAAMALALTVGFGLIAIGASGPRSDKAAVTNSAVLVRTNIMHGYVRTNLVNEIVASGEFCAVRGHVWSDYTPPSPTFTTSELQVDTEGNIVPKIYQPPVMRKCAVCGLKQSKVVREEWK